MWIEQYVNFHSFQHPHMASTYTQNKQTNKQTNNNNNKQVSPVAQQWRIHLQMQQTKETCI